MDVYATWIAITAVGVAGYLLIRYGYSRSGLLVLAIYATFGFDALAHYSLAPMSAHTAIMNLTIWLEALTAGLFLVTVAVFLAFGRNNEA